MMLLTDEGLNYINELPIRSFLIEIDQSKPIKSKTITREHSKAPSTVVNNIKEQMKNQVFSNQTFPKQALPNQATPSRVAGLRTMTLVMACICLLVLLTGCNQRRYKPSKWRPNLAATSLPAGSTLPGGSTLPITGGMWGSTLPGRGTLPSGGWMPQRGTLPLGSWSTLPSRGTLPLQGNWSTLPQNPMKRYLLSPSGNTLPKWSPIRGGNTLPVSRFNPLRQP
jgi:hypothetical protein